ncbi:hypothetical protein MD484_g2185, partial [Candolleomyces efflorescens]
MGLSLTYDASYDLGGRELEPEVQIRRIDESILALSLLEVARSTLTNIVRIIAFIWNGL